MTFNVVLETEPRVLIPGAFKNVVMPARVTFPALRLPSVLKPVTTAVVAVASPKVVIPATFRPLVAMLIP